MRFPCPEVHGFGLERYIVDPLVITKGKAIAPDRPGHAVRFDWAGLEKTRD
jgi:L-alanine-DL-glutamate epimerase-like enolase superfamily enzyme